MRSPSSSDGSQKLIYWAGPAANELVIHALTPLSDNITNFLKTALMGQMGII